MGSEDNGSKVPPERQHPAPTIDLKANEVSSRVIDGNEPSADTAGTESPEAVKNSIPDPAADPAQAVPKEGVSAGLLSRPVLWAVSACTAIALFGLGVWLGMSWMNRDEQLSQIVTRLVRIEAVLANATAAESAVKLTAENLASLNKRFDDIVGSVRDARSRADNAAVAAEAAQKAAGNAPEQGRGDTEALANRIAALEQSTRTSEKDLAADDKASRRAIIASALRDAVERGNPFIAEIAAARLFAGSVASLAPLEAYAPSGVPVLATLARELSALVPPMMKTLAEPTRTGGVMDKIQASAERLVRIRPVGDTPGDDTATLVARIEAKAARNDIDGALADLAKLPASVRAPAEAWIKRAAARDAAIAASRQFAQEALGALGKSPQ